MKGVALSSLLYRLTAALLGLIALCIIAAAGTLRAFAGEEPSPGPVPPSPRPSPAVRISPVPPPSARKSPAALPKGPPRPSPDTKPASSPEASPCEKASAGDGDFDDALDSLNLRKEMKTFIVCGRKMNVPVVVQQKYQDVYLRLNAPEFQDIMKRLCGEMTFDAASKTIACSRLTGGKKEEFTIRLDAPEVPDGKEKARLSPPPFAVRGEAFLCLKHVPLLTGAVLSFDDEEGAWYLDPALESVELHEEKKRFVLKAEATGPFETNSFILKNPRRFVLDLVNVHLSRRLLQSPEKAVFNSTTGRIVYSQNQAEPNRVRIVVPLQEGLNVQELAREKKNEALVALSVRKPTSVGVNFSTQKVTKVNVTPGKDAVKVFIDVTGPVEYAWHRFPAPDNRIFLDIHKALLVGKKVNMDLDNPLVEEVRTGQFQSTPEPIVRVVLDLKKRYRCTIERKGRIKDDLELVVTRETVAAEDTALDGTGATDFPNRGKQVICIDPGHGGMDSGAVNNAMKIYEKTITLEVSKALSRILVADGWNVVLTRNTDRDVSYYGSSDQEELGARVKVARDMKADVFVSIHCDASASPVVHGISTHWYKECDRDLAVSIHRKMINDLGNLDRKAQRSRFYLLTGSTMPSALVEIAFITNREDAGNLVTPAYRERIARALASGITSYLRTCRNPAGKKSAPAKVSTGARAPSVKKPKSWKNPNTIKIPPVEK